LIHHHQSGTVWRAPRVTLPITGALPVPGFPDRDYGVFLASGQGPSGPALSGVKVKWGDEAITSWTVPLSELPSHSACVFQEKGPITVLLAANTAASSRLSRLDIDENGHVTSAARVPRSSSNEILAIAADMRPNKPLAFLVLEAGRGKPNHLVLVRVPLIGDPELHELGVIP